MTDLLFYFFSLVALAAALVMVLNPNAVAAMAMIVSFVATAALFVLLEALFGYHSSAGLRASWCSSFIIMLLDVDKVETAYRFDHWNFGRLWFLAPGSMLVVGLGSTHLPVPPIELVTSSPDQVSQGSGIPFTSSSKSFGYSLFTKYIHSVGFYSGPQCWALS